MMVRQEFIRYASIGLLLNAALYVAYLGLTRTLMGREMAMSVTYAVGVLTGFALNRRITFRYRCRNLDALLRYIVVYIIGYLINLTSLWLLVGRAGLPHEFVQGGIISILPAILFILQKYWVFSDHSRNSLAVRAESTP
jgi:putative flippase GtrA